MSLGFVEGGWGERKVVNRGWYQWGRSEMRLWSLTRVRSERRPNHRRDWDGESDWVRDDHKWWETKMNLSERRPQIVTYEDEPGRETTTIEKWMRKNMYSRTLVWTWERICLDFAMGGRPSQPLILFRDLCLGEKKNKLAQFFRRARKWETRPLWRSSSL